MKSDRPRRDAKLATAVVDGRIAPRPRLSRERSSMNDTVFLRF